MHSRVWFFLLPHTPLPFAGAMYPVWTACPGHGMVPSVLRGEVGLTAEALLSIHRSSWSQEENNQRFFLPLLRTFALEPYNWLGINLYYIYKYMYKYLNIYVTVTWISLNNYSLNIRSKLYTKYRFFIKFTYTCSYNFTIY